MRRRRALVLLALMLAIAPAQAQAQGQAQAQAQASAIVRMETAFDTNLTVTLVAEAPLTLVLPDGTNATLEAGANLSYLAPVERTATAFLVADASDVLPAGVANVSLEAPAGWGAAASSRALVFGRDLVVEERLAGTTRVRLASVGTPREEDLALAVGGVAYLSAQHERAPRELLLVRAPDGFAARESHFEDALVVPAQADAEAFAGSLARLHQGYRVVEVAPTSASWFREGEERAQTHLALMAAGLRTAAEVEETFTRALAVAEPDALLLESPAGSTFSRNKGLVVVRALDAEIRSATRGASGLADLLTLLDHTSGRLDSVAIEEGARSLAGDAASDFFARYVYGTDWPVPPAVRDAADVFVTSLVLSPARASPDEQVVARFSATNRGTQPGSLDLVLALDRVPLTAHAVSLPIGGRVNDSLGLAAQTPGDHVVRLGSREAPLHVLAPARLSIARASTTPDAPRAGEAFALLVYVENAGEEAGRFRVEVYEGDRLLQRTTEALVAGESTDALTLPLRLDEPGLHALDIRLAGDATGELTHTIDVALAGDEREAPASASVVLVALAAIALLRRR